MNNFHSKPTKFGLLVLGLASFGLTTSDIANQPILPTSIGNQVPVGINGIGSQQQFGAKGYGLNAQQGGGQVQFGQQGGLENRFGGPKGGEFSEEKGGNLRANFENGQNKGGFQRQGAETGFGQGQQRQWGGASQNRRQEWNGVAQNGERPQGNFSQHKPQSFVRPEQFGAGQRGQFDQTRSQGAEFNQSKGYERTFSQNGELGQQRPGQAGGFGQRPPVSQGSATGFHAHTQIVSGAEHKEGDQRPVQGKPAVGGY